ncbi:MAG: alpha-N-arabinofuranosidase [Clostridiaceae bacterium]|nr:alpha-N-arabinofuranosidase [Clostridiaceae bacterium]
MNKITVGKITGAPTIDKNIYGHFSEHLGRCIYDGIFVGKDSPIPNVNGMRTDVVEAMKRIKLPVLRWPGGCFADEYHWRDGIGENRRRMVNTVWGDVVEDNSFGTHEFMELCRQVGCEPYVNINVGSGTVREMAEWVEYTNSNGDSTIVRERQANGHNEPFNVKYWGIGNENWGGGGNMRPEYYADVYRQFQTYCRTYGDNVPYKIACGPSDNNYEWTEVLMRNAGNYMDALTLHYYVFPKAWADKGSATEFDDALYLETLRKANLMDEYITGHSAIMDRYDPNRRVALLVDEWGCWHNVEPGTNPAFLYQQNAMRDAMVAALSLNIFNRHCGRVRMTNIAQVVNVLQSIILTDGDKMILTPTYHVFDMYKGHMDAELLKCMLECPKYENGLDKLSVSASQKDGVITMTIANFTDETSVTIEGIHAQDVSARILSAMPRSHNTFENPNQVSPESFEDIVMSENGATLTMPAYSIVSLSFTSK